MAVAVAVAVTVAVCRYDNAMPEVLGLPLSALVVGRPLCIHGIDNGSSQEVCEIGNADGGLIVRVECRQQRVGLFLGRDYSVGRF